MDDYQEIEIKESNLKRKWSVIVFFLLFFLVSFLFFKNSSTFSVLGGEIKEFWNKTISILPLNEDKRVTDVLFLGIRGIGNPPGELLTDTIMVIRYQKDTHQAAVISIPRDLYVDIPEYNKKEKVNFAYAFGEENGKKGGLKVAKETVEDITGLNIDYVIRADLEAFKEIIDILGGITIYLDKPFIEESQWTKEGKENSKVWKKIKKEIIDENGEKIEKWVWAFYLPAGKKFLDSETAAYYIRSRFSTSDFDRMRRQQQVLMAIKDKILSLGVLSNPIKVYKILESLGSHIQFSGNLAGILEIVKILDKINFQEIKTKVFDNSEKGPLYSTMNNGIYILLPKSGDFSEVRKECLNIFNEPVD